jgi:transposase
MRFAGLDVHKRVVEAVILDETGAVKKRARFACTREELARFVKENLASEDKLALEATTNTWGVVSVLKEHVGGVVVSNPLRTRAIAEAKVKTDRVDALVLAQLLRCDYLPRVWEPDPKTQLLRRLVSRRASLVQDRTTVKNRIHALLHQRLIPAPEEGSLFDRRGRRYLAEIPLDECGRQALESELRLLDAVETEVKEISLAIARHGYQDARVKLLLTLPGVDVAVAQTLLATLGDVGRFRDGDHAASYLGIVPSTRQSAEHCYHGPITKQGRGHARWMLVQAAQHLALHPGPLGVFFRRLAKKKNRNLAVVATARKLVVIAWHMLRNNEPYRYAQPRPTQQKLARLRVAGGGPKRRGASLKGTKRPPPNGGTRAIPSLVQLYRSEGLPSTNPLPEGERRAIEQARIGEFVDNLAVPHRIPRRAPSSSSS